MEPSLILIRGLPGSGKSTLAKKEFRNKGFIHYEADMFFERTGEYIFDPSKLKDAHAWCQKVTKYALGYGGKVVVSNTFVRLWEIQPYLDIAEEAGCLKVKVIKCVGNYGSVHGVPLETIERMKRNWEDYPGEEIYNGNN